MKSIITACCLFFSLFNFAQVPDLIWAKSVGGAYYDSGNRIEVDDAGNTFVAGAFRDMVDFDPGSSAVNLTSAGESDVFLLKINEDGEHLWSAKFGSLLIDNTGDLMTDQAGNIYLSGMFQGTVDFDPGLSVSELTSSGAMDVFLLKLDANGNFLWAKNFGGTSFDTNYGIEFDGLENIFLTGTFIGTVDFDPGAGIFNSSSVGSGSADAYILKLDPSGTFAWAKTFGGDASDYSYSVAVDNAGNIYTTGSFSDSVDFDPGASVTSAVSVTGQSDVYLHKLSPSGDFVWVKTFGGTASDYGGEVIVNNTGGIYLAGGFDENVDFDPTGGIATITAVDSSDIFLTHYDTAGNFLWVKSIGGTGFDNVSGIILDPSGDLFAIGTFKNTVDFDPGIGVSELTAIHKEDGFILKLTDDGNFSWVTRFGGLNAQWVNDICLDADNNIYTTGLFNDVVDFDPQSGTTNLTSNGVQDIFIHKMGATPTTTSLINHSQNKPELVLYPNPSNSFLQVHVVFNHTLINPEIHLYSIDGKLLLSMKLSESTNTLDLSDFDSGLYVMHLYNNGVLADSKQISLIRN